MSEMYLETKETTSAGTTPASEQTRYEPRFRVVTRRPLASRPIRVNSAQRTAIFAAVPAFLLLVYVLFWTMAMRGSYYHQQLQARSDELRIEQRELLAEKRRLTSPAHVLDAAAQLGMAPAMQREFAQVHVAVPKSSR